MAKTSVLLALAALAGARADYFLTNLFLGNQKCAGTPYQTLAQLTGCVPQGTPSGGITASLTLHCLNATAALANVYPNTDCTGAFRTIAIPLPGTSCSAEGQDSSISTCQPGSYSASAQPAVPAAPSPPPALTPDP